MSELDETEGLKHSAILDKAEAMYLKDGLSENINPIQVFPNCKYTSTAPFP